MPRTFVAIDLPEIVADRLQEVAYGLPGAVWVPPHQYHLTLRFLGNVEDYLFDNIRHALEEVRAESFYFDLKSVGHFPLRGNPEVLWAGVAANDPLTRLRNRVESALSRAGVESEGRKFHPHVTLGRVKNGAGQHVGDFEAQHSLLNIREVPVEYFHLYSSRLSPDGALHLLEHTYPLEGLLEGGPDRDD